MSLAHAKTKLRLGRGIQIGINTWYVNPQRRRAVILKVQHGRVHEVGIANRALTRTRHQQRLLLTSL